MGFGCSRGLQGLRHAVLRRVNLFFSRIPRNRQNSGKQLSSKTSFFSPTPPKKKKTTLLQKSEKNVCILCFYTYFFLCIHT